MHLSDNAHRRLFDASPNPYLILDRASNIVTANAAYLAATQRALGDIAGRGVWDAFPTDPATRRQQAASFERVFRTGRPDTMALLRYDIPRPGGEAGFETRYWTITHSPVFGDDGQVELVLQHPIDVTEIEGMRHAPPLAPASVPALAAGQSGLIDHARQVTQANLHLQADVDRLTALFQKAPGFMAVLRGPDHVCEFANEALHALLGRGDYVGKPLADTLPELAAPGVFERLDRVFASGEEFVGYDLPVLLTRPGEDAPEQRVINLIYQPIVEDGVVSGIFVEGSDVTERTRAAVETANAQAALRAERDEAQYIFDSMTEGFGLIDRDWTIVRMNATGLQMVGRTAAEVVGRDHWEVFPEAAGSELERICRSVKDSRQAGSVEYAYPLPDGGLRWMEVRVFPAMHGGIAVFFRDVTPRRSAEERLRRTAEHLRFTLDAARLGDWDMDLRTGASRRSPRHDECFGYPDPVAEWNLEIFLGHLHPDDRERVGHEFRWAVAEGRTWRTETRVVWPDGSVHWLAILGTVYAEHGEPHRLAGIVFDISERKFAEEQLRLEAHRKDEFLAMLAHELRNPLAPIGAAADLLVMGGLDPARMGRTSAIIKRQVGHMSSLIDDLLDVSRVTRGLVTLERGPVDIKATVADAVEQVRPLIEARRHRLALHLAPEHALVEGDRKRLVQVLANLLGNAAKYTPEGGRIVLEMDVETRDPRRVTLRVIDNGIGMSAATSAAAFELFTQAERTPDRSQGGLGIGLALVKSLVELHGGLVAAHSDGIGMGSRFTVCLPSMPPQPHADPAGLGARHEPGLLPAAGAGLVMIVDDNVDAAQLLAMLLENLGCEVLVEHDPHRALETAAARTPAVCILDSGLPDMDGNELARRLRRQAGMGDALLIAVTGYGRPEDRERALAAGFDQHLVKPVDVHALAALFGQGRRP
jgi:PAS domain S-box-containing protein